jgi:transposase-like protein
MVRPGRESLKGTVEVDETFIAITDRKQPVAKVGRKNNTTKTLVAIAVETLESKGFGRIRLRQIPDNTEQYLLPFVTETVEPGATVYTDGLSAYLALPKYGYLHKAHRNAWLRDIRLYLDARCSPRGVTYQALVVGYTPWRRTTRTTRRLLGRICVSL